MEASELNTPTLDLIDLCNKNPSLAHDFVMNASRYNSVTRNKITSIPWSIFSEQSLNTTHINRLITVKGSVIKAYEVLFKNVISEQLCLKCNETFYLTEADMNKKKRTNICESCGSSNVQFIQDFQQAISSQNIRIQDIGNPRSMSETTEVLLEGDLANKFIPGDKISVTGVVFRKWKPLRLNEPMISSICIRAVSVVKEEDNTNEFLDIRSEIESFSEKNSFEKRKFLLDSFSSDICGLFNVKMGMLLGLVGGTMENDKSGSNRGSSHILLVGDPGTGKSHLLNIASKLISPSIHTNGVGTSDAGLTSCAVKQGKDWSLEAGALVLADMGLCCIDEFNRLKLNEKSGLLESMEQQTLSIAKAGIVTSLNTRCSVFAAANTRYRYDIKKSVSENLAMSTPLVSRFDLIFGIFDRDSRENDPLKAEMVLQRDFTAKTPNWSIKTLKSYISHCRKKCNKITEDLSKILVKYYTKRKQLEGSNEFNTIRMLEGLVRLSEAHSKVMNESSLNEEDIYISIILMETCINSSGLIRIDADKAFIDEDTFDAVKKQLKKTFFL